MNVALKGEPRGLSALWRSYAGDLRGWVARLAARYGVAVALLAGGILAVFAAIAVGATALFHFIELRYGANAAFAAIGGGLLALGVILLLAGWLTMRRRAPPLPRPRRQFRAARQMLAGSTIARAVTALRENDAAKPDPTTQILLGAAAILAAGWIVATRLGSTSGRKVRR
ncbi:hypothetical protein [Bradyrhizobium sp.]|uniref:hypothetical protein n=1 Tax=Bradyrhizobium sp. TaxID=376 RepID=UPI003C677217